MRILMRKLPCSEKHFLSLKFICNLGFYLVFHLVTNIRKCDYFFPRFFCCCHKTDQVLLMVSDVWTYPGWGAAGPLCGRQLTACVTFGALKLPRAVTWYVCGVLRASRLQPLHFTLRDDVSEHVEVLLFAGSRLHVAGVVVRTAVLVVGTADRLKRRRRDLTSADSLLI